MLLKVQTLAGEVNKLYLTAFKAGKETINADMAEMAEYLGKKQAEEGVVFVYGSGKRKSNLQKLTEALYSYQERQEGYDESAKLLDGRNSYSKTDTDAAFMRMKENMTYNAEADI